MYTPDFLEAAEAQAEVLKMPLSELEALEAEPVKWVCCIEGCNRFSTVKNYGVWPFVFWRKKWHNLSQEQYYCAKHWEYFKRVPSKLIYKKYE